MRTISGLIAVFVSMPIWFYLLYKVLHAVGASDLMWFLYWIYVPASLFAQVLLRIAEAELKGTA